MCGHGVRMRIVWIMKYKDNWECYPRQGILKIGFNADNGIILQF